MEYLNILLPSPFACMDYDTESGVYFLYDARTSTYYQLNSSSRLIWELICSQKYSRPSLIAEYASKCQIEFLVSSSIVRPFVDRLLMKQLVKIQKP